VSRELIEALRAAAAFDATPLPEDLAALHVPFDDLLGDEKTERELRKAAEASGRIALVGAMGAGKSSVLSYALTPSEGFAPIPISVAPESDETVTDPGRFAQHVVRVISTWAAEVEMLTPVQRDELLRSVAKDRVLPARSKGTHAGLSVQLPWLAKGEFARDIKRDLAPAAEVERSAVEYLDALKRLMRLIRAIELQPVLIIDDSDRWLRRGEPRPDIVGAFFGRIVRELAELETSLAIAVHEHYISLDEYRDNTVGVINTRIDVPELTDEGQLARILDHRVQVMSAGEGSAEILDADGLARLWQFYAGECGRSLRKTLQIAHTALGEAARAEADRVGLALIESSIAAWEPET
jgi:hypothetical protein